MSVGRLEAFCAELRDIAGRIGIPEAAVPTCGEPASVGYSVTLSADRQDYVLFYAERGVPAVVVQSPDKDEVMERIFADLTEGLAVNEVVERYPPFGFWRSLLGDLGRPNPIKQQREIQIVQEALLSRANAGWSERRAIENAMRLRRDVDFYFGVQ